MISLVLPTRDRSDFLARQLLYYRRMGFQGSIRIGDASKGEHLENNKKLVRGLKGELDIVHREFPVGNVHHCVQELAAQVKTPYIAFVSDDDFLVPSGLEASRLFLEEHPDYDIAHGTAMKIQTRGDMPYGPVTSVRRAKQPVEEADSASERLMHFMAQVGDVHYSLHRVDRFRSTYEGVDLFTDRRFSDALLPNCLAVIDSKIGEVDSLSLVRHNQRKPTRVKEQTDGLFWITRETWRADFDRFRDILAGRLALKDGIDLQEAARAVEVGFSFYLIGAIRTGVLRSQPEYKQFVSYPRTRDTKTFGQVRSVGSRIPGARPIWNWVDSSLIHRRTRRYQDSSSAIAEYSPQFDEDFMPVYQAATNAPEFL